MIFYNLDTLNTDFIFKLSNCTKLNLTKGVIHSLKTIPVLLIKSPYLFIQEVEPQSLL